MAGRQYQLETKRNTLQEKYRKTGVLKRTKEYQTEILDELTVLGVEYQTLQGKLKDKLPEGEDDRPSPILGFIRVTLEFA